MRLAFHLNFCRRCRTPPAAIEAAGNSWKEACLRPFEVSAERVAAARRGFLERVSADRRAVPSLVPVWPTGVRVTVVAAGLACAVMAGIGVWSVRETPVAP